MILGDNLTFYDILDITSDASPQEVRAAYVRSKATYAKDSVALYTLITPEEREDALQKIEEAYHILSDPERRRAYDENYGSAHTLENPFAPSSLPPNVISIDRSSLSNSESLGSEELLIPPTTDFNPSSNSGSEQTQQNLDPIPLVPKSQKTTHEPSHEDVFHSTLAPADGPSLRAEAPPLYKPPAELRPPVQELERAFIDAIESETEWKGAFLRRVRDAHKISLEEMSGVTKVSKNYIIAIEEDDFKKLPAPVYVRGFVAQIARVLKLPHEKVASAYLSRYHRGR